MATVEFMREYLTNLVNEVVKSPPTTFNLTFNVLGTGRTWVKAVSETGKLSVDFDNPKDPRLAILTAWAEAHQKMPVLSP